MIFLILALLIFASIILEVGYKAKIWDAAFIMGLLFGGVIFFLGSFLASEIYIDFHSKSAEFKNTWEREIVSLNNRNGVDGSFFLGCGSIGTEENYYTFVKDKRSDEEYFYRRATFSVSNTFIKESSTIGPKAVEITRSVSVPKWLSLINFSRDSRSYVLYVPKGTIIQQFELK